ncbi:SDR family NAD(P)-dependent oxidoreductase [Streptomyces nondiastaticus]|uniref:SDR family NAD(P)-dependent oxidoreductase n=1 Tax=Streptomyces nondiastaticus TaxID=3154512 RepID=UPI00344AD5CF
MTELSLDAKVAVVTGAETEIGAAVAAELARRGAAVAVQYFASFPRAKQVVRDIEKAGGQAVAIKADLQDRAQTELMCKKAGGAFGDVGLVVVTEPEYPDPADGGAGGAAGEIAEAVRAQLLACLGPVYATLPGMVARGTGTLVHVAGSAPSEPAVPGPARAASRAAVGAALGRLSAEYGAAGIVTHTLPSGPVQHVAQRVALLASGAPAADATT